MSLFHMYEVFVMKRLSCMEANTMKCKVGLKDERGSCNNVYSTEE